MIKLYKLIKITEKHEIIRVTLYIIYNKMNKLLNGKKKKKF